MVGKMALPAIVVKAVLVIKMTLPLRVVKAELHI